MPKDIRVQIKQHVSDVPRRLVEIDSELEVWYNLFSEMFEVWGKDAADRRYCLGTWPRLDVRVVRAVRKGYWLARNTGDPYRAVIREQNDQEYKEDKRLEQEREELPNIIKGETRWLIGGQWRGCEVGV